MALKIGDKAPEFTLLDSTKKERSLKEFSGKKLLIAFFPGVFTGVCTKEMCNFRDSLSNFENAKLQVVGISVDPHYALKGFADANKLNFPLMSDYTRKVSEQYCGVYNDFAGMPGFSASKRAVFILDAQGVVRYAWVSDAPGVEPPYAEVNKAAQAIH
jgi:peroxiredoxin